MLVLQLEGLVLASKDVQKGYGTFSIERYGRCLHCFITRSEIEAQFFAMKQAKTKAEQLTFRHNSIVLCFIMAGFV